MKKLISLNSLYFKMGLFITIIIFITVFSVQFTQASESKKTIVRLSKNIDSLSKASSVLQPLGFKIIKFHKKLSVAIVETLVKSEISGLTSKSSNEKTSLDQNKTQNLLSTEDEITWKIYQEMNDPNFKDQKSLKRLNVPKAWKVAREKGKEVVVAVLDSGVDWSHRDLQNMIWVNSDEIPENGIDDDDNGYIDDYQGWDFYSKDNDPSDPNDHGTHVAGIIGAEAGNHEGIAGVARKVRIMALKFMSPTGNGKTSDAIEAIMYAVENGADIINASWGSQQKSEALKEAIKYAGDQGVLFVAASGNESTDNDDTHHYPSDYELEGIVSVANSQSVGKLSSSSNYGRYSVDLAAPGTHVLSTVTGNNYERFSGTSMAAPMVSGVAALMLAEDKSMSVAELKNGLINAASYQKNYKGKLASEGELDALRAIEQLNTKFAIWPERVTVRTGEKYSFSTYFGVDNSDPGIVTWSLKGDEGVAILDQGGVLEAKGSGKVTVVAKLNTGETVETKFVTLGSGKKDVPSDEGSGGCEKSSSKNMTNVAKANAMFTLFLPAFFGIFRKKRHK